MKDYPQEFIDLLSPVSPQSFFDQYWEKQYLHTTGRQANRFEEFFSLRDIDRWCMTTRSGDRDSILLTTGPGGQQRKFRPRDVAVDTLYEAFNDGQSIVLNHLNDSWLPIAPFVQMLRSVFCADVGVNVYLTPRNAQTFPVHVDDHDVFILQIHGEKVWKLHELKMLTVDRLPLKGLLNTTADWGKKNRVHTPQQAELTLRPGDLLFVPRGMPHCAIAQDTSSLHITVSIVPLYWLDFFKIALEQATITCPELRRTLPPNLLYDPKSVETMRSQWRKVFEEFSREMTFEDTLDVLRRSRLRAQGFARDGHFAHLERAVDVQSSSMIERRPGVDCVVESYEPHDSATIRFCDRSVRGKRRILQVFEFIRDNERFRVSELPRLDAAGQIVMVRRLIKEGLLRFAEDAQPSSQVEEEALINEGYLLQPAAVEPQKEASPA
ncbi:MAG TPA: cupin domain-containing protein [Thermoanaerobaculia bacterium]|nr:cupin domain-containing protein [Thermoanaerobaculia bacterium]